ncbi:hypothetical protein [Cytobacillus sp.]|uniref:hypothetical protein n=1 Tax=Cytobacillus sp. TaxID=2675269 RepID=UPI003512810F
MKNIDMISIDNEKSHKLETAKSPPARNSLESARKSKIPAHTLSQAEHQNVLAVQKKPTRAKLTGIRAQK